MTAEQLPIELPPAAEVDEPPRVTHRYAALCVTCPWEGPARSSDLTAVRDFDRHVLTFDHAMAVVEARNPAPDEEGES